MKPLRVILSGGGTGGHIFPAVAIANELKKLVPQVEILFVGANGRMEMEKIPAAGYKIIGIPIAGLQRRFTWSNFKLPFLVIKSLLKTKKIVREFAPQVVVGTGGYASGPLLRSAMAQGIPALLQEQNSYAGITNKILSKKASRICVAYEGMERFFPAEKIVITGNPVRQDLAEVKHKRKEAIEYFRLDETQKTILIIGGSGGARTINESITHGLNKFQKSKVQLLWQTGKNYFESTLRSLKDTTDNTAHVYEFITRMDLAYAAADLVISRAGASSVSELCNLGMACILVPSPNVAEDHQTKNALALATKNAAVVVADKDAHNDLVDRSLTLLADSGKLAELQQNSRKLAHYDSADRIAREVLKLANYSLP